MPLVSKYASPEEAQAAKLEKQRRRRATPEGKANERRWGRQQYARNPDRGKQRSKEWAAANRDKVVSLRRKHELKKNYGLSLEDYEGLLQKQNGVCAICSGPPVGRGTNYHVDHDHKTGKVRGLLCHHCNVSLGGFKDSSEILDRAIAYLKRTEGDSLE